MPKIQMPKCGVCGTTDDVFPCQVCKNLYCKDCTRIYAPYDGGDWMWFEDCEHMPYEEAEKAVDWPSPFVGEHDILKQQEPKDAI